MASISDIPLPEQGIDAFLKQLQQNQENRRAQEKMQQDVLQNEQLNKYRQQELGLRQDALNETRKKIPLTMELLKAQIENQKSLTSNRNKNQGVMNGLTKANITKNQGIMQAVDNVVPLITELSKSEFPGQTVGKYIHPNQEAAYKAKTAAIADTLVSAMALPKTNESLELVKTMVVQHPFESREAYKTRLIGLLNDLSSRKNRASLALRNGLFGDSGDNIDNSSTNSNAGTDTNLEVDENGNLVES